VERLRERRIDPLALPRVEIVAEDVDVRGPLEVPHAL
jgi:hypothetical protein